MGVFQTWTDEISLKYGSTAIRGKLDSRTVFLRLYTNDTGAVCVAIVSGSSTLQIQKQIAALWHAIAII